MRESFRHRVPVARLAGAAYLALFLVICPAPAPGQQAATATIEGVINDPNGAVVPGATVTAKNVETGFTREIQTDESGVYRLPLLPPGAYDLTVTAPNFTQARRGGVRLTVGQKLNLDISLSVTGGTETVNITAEVPIVETSRPSVSNSVNERAVSDLPVNGRNFIDFVTLTPGVVRDPRGGDLSFGGQRGTFNSLQIDGVDNNNLFFGQTLGRSGSGRAPYQFSQDAVKEFQVNTNTFSAEFGRAAGGLINVITKSGTNEFHGTGFEFYRDRSLNANSLRFDARAGSAGTGALVPNTVKPAYHFHQFGGNIGGPVKRDRAFFFFDYDGQRSTTPNVVAFGVVPPIANDPSPADTQRGYQSLLPFQESYTRGFNQDVYLGKVDLQLDDANRIGFRYNRQNFTGRNLESSGATSALEHTGNSNVTTDTFTVTLNTAFSPRFLNEFRAQVARDREPGFANSDLPEANIAQGGQTVIVIGRNNFSPRETTEDKYQLIDNVSYITGAHSFKGGLDVNIEKILNFFPGQFGGRYFFDSYAQYALNQPSRYAQAFAGVGTTGPTSKPNFNEFGFFLQDDWRISTGLTVNLGVRYDIQKLKAPPVFNPDPRLAAAGIDTSRLANDYNNVAPRFGFAWKPLASDRLVARGGYGLFYGRTPAIMLGTAHTQNALSVILIELAGNRLPPGFIYPARFSDLSQVAAFAPSTPSIYVFEKNYQQPYTQQASLGLEYGLTGDISVGASYLFVKGAHLQRTRDINLFAPAPYPAFGYPNFLRHPGVQGTPDRPVAGFARISQFESNANSNYNALVLQVKKRFSRRFQFDASYTFSKVIDDKPDATSVVPFNTGDDSKQAQQSFFLRDDRGPGDANIPHRFVASGLWDISYFSGLGGVARAVVDGWQASGILQANSNLPFSATVGQTDLNNDGNRFTDRVPGFGRNSYRRDKFVGLDFRLTKNFFLTESVRLQFIGEFFNIINRVNFSSFNGQFANLTIATSGAGADARNPRVTITPRQDFADPRATFEPRIGQLALKLIF